MKITLDRVDDAFHLEGKGMSPVVVHLDAAEEIGGKNAGSRPMELLLMGLGGCTSIDVILVLKKQRQELRDLKIEVTGEREQIEGTEMKPFRKIKIHYKFYGPLDAAKVERAIELSMDKYCSATAQLRPSAEITHSYEILP
ncbi:OsmC family protein [Leadbetterella byssophila]|uniref:OsmC family protein n=1 Tax=Leadbetterella byssophila TaxID=316068 RepID=UPI00399FE31D